MSRQSSLDVAAAAGFDTRDLDDETLRQAHKGLPRVPSLEFLEVEEPTHVLEAWRLLRYHVPTIEHFLRTVVYNTVTSHREAKISASAQELGSDTLFDVRFGFSGTANDLTPMAMGPCRFERGSEGRIIHVLTDPKVVSMADLPGFSGATAGEGVADAEGWTVRGLLRAVARADPPYHALIDCGALVFGMDNEEVARFLLKEGLKGMDGVVYFDRHDDKRILVRGNPRPQLLSEVGIDPSKRTSFYDQSHCVGADLAQAPTARALLTLGKDSDVRAVSQAAWRMRGIAKGQTVELLLTPEIQGLVIRSAGSLWGSEPVPVSVLAWLTRNTIEHERLQHAQLRQQDLEQVWRKSALADLLLAHGGVRRRDAKEGEVPRTQEALKDALAVFREDVDFSFKGEAAPGDPGEDDEGMPFEQSLEQQLEGVNQFVRPSSEAALAEIRRRAQAAKQQREEQRQARMKEQQDATGAGGLQAGKEDKEDELLAAQRAAARRLDENMIQEKEAQKEQEEQKEEQKQVTHMKWYAAADVKLGDRSPADLDAVLAAARAASAVAAEQAERARLRAVLSEQASQGAGTSESKSGGDDGAPRDLTEEEQATLGRLQAAAADAVEASAGHFHSLAKWQPHQDQPPLASVGQDLFISKGWAPPRIVFQPDFRLKLAEVAVRVALPGGAPDQSTAAPLELVEDTTSKGTVAATGGGQGASDPYGFRSPSMLGVGRTPSQSGADARSTAHDGAATMLVPLADAAALRRMLHGAMRNGSGGLVSEQSPDALGVARSAEVYLPSSGTVLDLPPVGGDTAETGSGAGGSAATGAGEADAPQRDLAARLNRLVPDRHLPRALLKLMNADLYYSSSGVRALLRAMSRVAVADRERFFQTMVERRRERPRASWAGTPLATLFTTRDEGHLRARRQLIARVADAMASGGVSISRLFEAADGDHSGLLSPEDLNGLLSQAGVQLAPSEVGELVAAIDQDGDGAISLHELRSALTQSKGISAATSKVLSGATSPIAGGAAGIEAGGLDAISMARVASWQPEAQQSGAGADHGKSNDSYGM